MEHLATGFAYNMDCLEGLRRVGSGSVKLIVADPPYFLGLTSNGKKGSLSDLNICKPFYQSLVSEFKRVLQDNGSLFFFCDFRSYPFYYAILQDILGVTNCIIWNKLAGPGNKYGFNHEFIVFCTLDKTFSKGGSNVWDIAGFANPTQRAKENQVFDSQKPVSLITQIVQEHSSKGELVLDPFLGSGTTAVVCQQIKRDFIGFELDDKNFSIIEQRLKNKK